MMNQKLKLFVVGSNSVNPENWSGWDEIELVIAQDKSEALQLISGRGHGGKIAEIPLTKSMILHSTSSPEL